MILEKIKSEYYMCRIPGIIATSKKTLICYYECRSEYSDWAQIDLKVIRSQDGGKTFEKVHLVKGEGHTLNNPMMVEKDGVIHFLYLKNYHDLYYCTSTDDGKTFSEPVDITYALTDGGFFYNAAAIGPGHAIVHGNRILMPIWFAYNKEDPSAHGPSFIATLYSDDNGRSWQLGERIGEDLFLNPSECALASVGNEVIISIRNQNACRLRGIAKSKTGIDSWQNVTFAGNLPDPECMGSMDCVGDTVYHINCAFQNRTLAHRGRINLTVKASDDNFKTFRSVLIDQKGGYSDIAIVDDKMHIIYERDFKDNENYALIFTTLKKV